MIRRCKPILVVSVMLPALLLSSHLGVLHHHHLGHGQHNHFSTGDNAGAGGHCHGAHASDSSHAVASLLDACPDSLVRRVEGAETPGLAAACWLCQTLGTHIPDVFVPFDWQLGSVVSTASILFVLPAITDFPAAYSCRGPPLTFA